MYKPSMYNLTKENIQGELVIINTLSSKSVTLHGERKSKIKRLLDQESISQLDLTGEKDMLEAGFFVKSNTDEYKLASYKYYDEVLGSNTLELTIIVTDDCNFKCLYCYQEDRESRLINDEVLSGILLYISKYGSNYKKIRINWFGGEPLLAKEKIISFMRECASICKNKNIPLMGFISTNGYNLDIETFNQLLNSYILFYQVTLDGNSIIHNKYRPHKLYDNSYETIIENLKRINNEVKGYYRVSVRINLNKAIFKELANFIDEIAFMSNNRKFDFNCQKMSDYGGEGIKSLGDEMINDDELDMVIHELTKREFFLLKHPFFDFASGVCTAGRKNSYYITQEGRLIKCSLAIYDSDMSEVNIVGRIDKNGDLTLDKEKLSKWVIRDDPDESCKKCSYFPICGNHYCPYRRLKNNKKICYMYKKHINIF